MIKAVEVGDIIRSLTNDEGEVREGELYEVIATEDDCIYIRCEKETYYSEPEDVKLEGNFCYLASYEYEVVIHDGVVIN